MELGDFLRGQLSNGAPWNCSTLPADWCVTLGLPDFAADWREVTGAEECEEEPHAAGGLVALWDRAIGDALLVVANTEPGDIAVVTVAGVEAGAIWTGTRWALRAKRGLHFIDPDGVVALKVWRP